MWYDELFASKTWIVNIAVAVVTAPISVYAGILIERMRTKRKHKRLAGLVGAYQLWQPTAQGETPTGTVHIHKQVNEVLYFNGKSALTNKPQGSFSGTLIFPNSWTDNISGSYKHETVDLFGQLEGVVDGAWPSPGFLLLSRP